MPENEKARAVSEFVSAIRTLAEILGVEPKTLVAQVKASFKERLETSLDGIFVAVEEELKKNPNDAIPL